MTKQNFIGNVLLISAVMAFMASPVLATTIGLADWAFNVDGQIYEHSKGESRPTTGMLTDGLGTLSWTTSEMGPHTFIAFFDHDIDKNLNTFSNEYGDRGGSLATGQSWEIDEPGWGTSYCGDIYRHALNGSLDNKNFNGNSYTGDDVSMALGWYFTLAANETATISLILNDSMPTSGFYLSQTDPETGGTNSNDYSPESTLYFSSTLDIQPSAPVPEPATILLMGIGLIGILGVRKKRGK